MSPWSKRNALTLTVFAPVLVLTGVAGFFLPANPNLMSNAAPYNVFHVIAGFVGLGLVLMKQARAVAGFNFAFGLIDLWQAMAGVTGLFPAALFALQPADHVVHVLIGLPLMLLGWQGIRALPSGGVAVS
jgi:hypothetical protein